MKVSEILQLDVFKNAVIKTKEIGLDRDVDSVMVLEATDIERWGKKNQLILTSYFALKEMSYSDLEVFFEKLVQIDIGGIVLKINRLIDETPEELLNRVLSIGYR